MDAKLVLFLTIVCAISGYCAAADRPKVSAATLRKAAMVIVGDCMEKTGASETDIAPMKEKNLPTTEKGKCVLECLFNTAGSMKNGKFAKETVYKRHMTIVGGANPENDAKFKKVVDDCEKEAEKGGDNGCLVAGNLAACMRKHREDAGIKIPTLEELGFN